MIKISKKVGIALAITGLILFGTLTYGVSQIKLDTAKTVIKGGVEPFEEMGSVLLNEKLADEFIQFEYQCLLAEYYSHAKDYVAAHTHYEKAVKSAKASLGEKSIFTHFAYFGESVAEKENGQYLESNEHCKAALKALPDVEAYDVFRCATQSLLIYTTVDKSNPNNIPLYREHLALREKLESLPGGRNHVVYALSLLANALDNDEKEDEAERTWKRMITAAHNKDYPKHQLVQRLLDFASHKSRTGKQSEADQLLAEATAVAAQTSDDMAMASVLNLKGQFCLYADDSDAAEATFKKQLTLVQKSESKCEHGWVYEWLAEVERRRGNLSARENYLEKALQSEQQPWQKLLLLPKLAIVARLNNKNEVARSYVEQWKQLPKHAYSSGMFIRKREVDAFLILYPKLAIGKLKPYEVKFFSQVEFYDFSSQQLDKLMNAI